MTLFMVVERFRPGMAEAVYARFAERGRMAPATARYVASWVDLEFERCFQLMEAGSEDALREWAAHWEDLVEFEIVAVRTSEDAAQVMNARPIVVQQTYGAPSVPPRG